MTVAATDMAHASAPVDPSATWVTKRVGYDRLVLTACHPKYSAAQRIVTFARLQRATQLAFWTSVRT